MKEIDAESENSPNPYANEIKKFFLTFSLQKSHHKGGFLSLVGTRGFEPPTSCTPCKRSTRLNYVPFSSHNNSISFRMQDVRHLVLLRKPCSARKPNFASVKQTLIAPAVAVAPWCNNSFYPDNIKNIRRIFFILSAPCKRSALPFTIIQIT